MSHKGHSLDSALEYRLWQYPERGCPTERGGVNIICYIDDTLVVTVFGSFLQNICHFFFFNFVLKLFRYLGFTQNLIENLSEIKKNMLSFQKILLLLINN